MDEAENNIGYIKIVWRQGLAVFSSFLVSVVGGMWFRNGTTRHQQQTRYHENTARPCLHTILMYPMLFSASSMCSYTP
jgi:hypothetical protein